MKLYFTHYNENKYKTNTYYNDTSSQNRVIVAPIARTPFDGNYMIYPSPNGFTKGIHIWSVKFIKCNGCIGEYRSIGVTPNMNEKWITNGIGCYKPWPTDDENENASYYYAFENVDNKWKLGSTITVSLNLDRGIVKYFCDGKRMKTDELKVAHGPFYFALCTESNYRCNTFESVDYKYLTSTLYNDYTHGSI